MISDINMQIASTQVLTTAAGARTVTEDAVDVAGVALTAMTNPNGGTPIAAGARLQRDIGEGEPLYMVFTNVGGATFTGVTSVVFEVITSENTNLSAPRVLIRSAEIPVATMVAGKEIVLRIQLDPADKDNTLDRYMGGAVSAIGGGGPLANASIDCHIVHGNQKGGKKFYPTSIIVEP